MGIVVDEEGLLAMVVGVVEKKVRRSRFIEEHLASPGGQAKLSGGDVIGKLFVNEAVDRIGSGFKFVVTKARGDGGADIAFAEAAILKRLNGPGRCAGSKVGFVVAHAALPGTEDTGKGGMRIGNLA